LAFFLQSPNGNQRLFLISRLKHTDSHWTNLHITKLLTQSNITYALPAFAGQLRSGNLSNLSCFFRRFCSL